MAGKTLKTEAVVLRGIRYGDADRILHLYSLQRGRIGAIAKGARRPKSRFGGRLEPFFRLNLLLHEGRGELLTVTQVSTVDGYPRLRSSGPALTAAALEPRSDAGELPGSTPSWVDVIEPGPKTQRTARSTRPPLLL